MTITTLIRKFKITKSSNMTFGELLHKVTFKELVPFLSFFEDYNWNLASYKMHYDYLCHLSEINKEPDNTSKDTLHSNDKKYISLASELLTEVTVNGSLAKTAADRLWNTMHFYGIGEYQNTELMQLSNRDLEKSAYRYRKSFQKTTRHAMKRYNKSYTLKRKTNVYLSSYKNRDWRYWKLCEMKSEYNKRICEIGAFIEDLHNRGLNIIAPPDFDYLSVLFKANHCLIKTWRSYVYDSTKRYNYFQNLIEKYNLLFWIRDSNCILCISSSPDYPLTVEEMNLLYLITGNRKGENVFCIKTDSSLGKDLRIDAAFYTV